MSDVITLSSEEEDESTSPPRKRIKPAYLQEISITPIENFKKTNNKSEDVVVLSDEDDNSSVSMRSPQNLDHDLKKSAEFLIIKDDDNDSITFIDDKDEPAVNVENGDEDESSEHKKETSGKEEENAITEYAEKECSDINDVSHDSSTESSRKENKEENHPENLSLPVNNIAEEPCTSVDSSLTVLENFLNVCSQTIHNSQYAHLKNKQFPMLRKYFKKCGLKLRESTNFLKLIEENMERVKKSPAKAVISFNEVFQYVKELVDADSIEVSEKHRIDLKKLEKTMKLLIIKIKQLERLEINFDEEEDSSYMKLDRYITRLNKVHERYCKLLNKNPNSGRITYERLDFVHSEYNDINKAINKKYKNNKKFPSYIEMENLIKKVVAEHNLMLSEAKIKGESVHCFEKLGELLQGRRKKELYDAHYLYIRDSEDPASTDTSLDSTLKQNFTEGQIKIEKLCDEYTTKELTGVEVVLSEEDSNDKSDYVDSENEEIIHDLDE